MTVISRNAIPDISGLENLFVGKDGRIQPQPADALHDFTQEQISYFCHLYAIYQLPTTELIDFLKKEIEGPAIEIGSGNGCIGRSLGIPMTDSFLQDSPEIKHYYKSLGQPTIKYGADVETLDAIEAIKKYKPRTVVGCWVTHKYDERNMTGNMFGIREDQFLDLGVKKYIHVGNEDTHRYKPILKLRPHKEYSFPWLISRSANRAKNLIYIFQ